MSIHVLKNVSYSVEILLFTVTVDDVHLMNSHVGYNFVNESLNYPEMTLSSAMRTEIESLVFLFWS